MMHWRRPLVIVNPKAGRFGSEHNVAALATACFGTRADIRVVNGVSDARSWAQRAKREGYDIVIVAGGDGTVREAIAGLQHGGTLPLAIIPTGTANGLAGELGIPIDVRKAFALLENSTLRTIDIGYSATHDHFLLNAASIGFGAKVFDDANTRLKNIVGAPIYLFAALKNAIRVTTAHFVLELDGTKEEVNAQMVVIANTPLASMRVINFGPTIRPDDGVLDVIVFTHASFMKIVEMMIGMMLHPRTPHPDIHYFHAKNIRITSTPLLPVSIDGEHSQNAPLEVVVIPNGVEVVVPATHSETKS